MSSFRVKYGESLLDIAFARPADLDLAIPAESESIGQIMANYPESWVRASNCCYFEPSDPAWRWKAYGMVAKGVHKLNDYPSNWPALRVGLDGRAAISEDGSGYDPNREAWICAAGPLLVRGSRPTDIAAEIARGGYTGFADGVKKPQLAVGIRADGLVVHVAATYLTLSELAQVLVQLGCVTALKLDSGGSTVVYEHEAGAVPVVGQDLRRFPAALVIRQEQLAPADVAGFLGGRAQAPGPRPEYLGCDYSHRADGALPEFKLRGFSFVVRYLTPPGWWNRLSREEAQVIAQAGLALVSVWETNPTSPAFFTAERGTQEGSMARQAAREVGQPAGTPIYATVDYDMQPGEWLAVMAYMEAFQQALGGEYQLGVYGGYRVIDQAQQLTHWLWQTYAWSGGRLHPAAVLYQYQNGVEIGGADVDLDRAFGDPGWWRPDGQPVTATPAPPAEKGGSNVPLSKRGDQGVAISIIQLLLNVAGYGPVVTDGVFGLETEGQVRSFQRDHQLAVDGIVGPQTWGALAKITPAARSNQQELNDMATQIQNLTNALGDANAKLAQIKAIVG